MPRACGIRHLARRRDPVRPHPPGGSPGARLVDSGSARAEPVLRRSSTRSRCSATRSRCWAGRRRTGCTARPTPRPRSSPCTASAASTTGSSRSSRTSTACASSHPTSPASARRRPLPGRRHDLDAYADWLRAFAAAVAPGAVILGHSFGSIVVAAAVAGGLQTPRVILVNPIGAPALEGPRGVLTRLAVFYYWAGARLPQRGGGRAAAQRRDRARHERVDGQDPGCRPAALHPRPARHVLLALRRSRRAARRVPRVGVARRARVRAGASPQPTLLVAADRDDITPIEAERHLATLFPDAELVEIAGRRPPHPLRDAGAGGRGDHAVSRAFRSRYALTFMRLPQLPVSQ